MKMVALLLGLAFISCGKQKTSDLRTPDHELSVRYDSAEVETHSSVLELGQAEAIIANFKDDGIDGKNSGWRYYWNAPPGWVEGKSSGNIDKGGIDDLGSLRPMKKLGAHWLPDGDANGKNNTPAGYTRIFKGGGHPGDGHRDEIYARHAVVGYKFSSSGFYRLTNTSLSMINPSLSDGVSLRIFTKSKGLLLVKHIPSSDTEFSIDLGYMPIDDEVFLAVGPGPSGNAHHDGFKLEFLIRGKAGTLVSNYKSDFGKAGWKYFWDIISDDAVHLKLEDDSDSYPKAS